MKNTYTIEIDTAPGRVFYWVDNSERVMQWLPNLVENEDLEITDEKVGSTFRQVYLENGRRMEMTGEVTAYETNRQLAVELNGPAFDLFVGYRFDDLGGRTRLTQESSVKFKGLYKIMGPIMTPFVRKSAQKQLEDSFAKLKSLAESSGQP